MPSGGRACRIVCPDGRAISLSPGATCEVGRGNLDVSFDHVSRAQARISLDATGSTVLVVSLGGNPTGVRADPTAAAWTWLAKGKSTEVGTSAQLCLDRRRTTEALLTVELDAAAATAAAASSSSSSSKAKLPAGATVVSLDSDDDEPSALSPPPRSIAERVDAWRIVWDGSLSEPLDAWLNATQPSLVSRQICAWVQVHNHAPSTPGYQAPGEGGHFVEAPYLPELAKLAALERKPKAAKEACAAHILSTAQRQGYTTGKWILRVPPAVADEVWRKVARATADGTLGCSAKIGPALGVDANEMVVCCVYVADFANRPEVRRVLLALLALEIRVEAQLCGFKPDAYTGLGINSGNQWKLDPTIYSVADVKEWPA